MTDIQVQLIYIQRGLNEKKSQILTNLQKSAHDMLTSSSNYVCKERALEVGAEKISHLGNFSVLYLLLHFLHI